MTWVSVMMRRMGPLARLDWLLLALLVIVTPLSMRFIDRQEKSDGISLETAAAEQISPAVPLEHLSQEQLRQLLQERLADRPGLIRWMIFVGIFLLAILGLALWNLFWIGARLIRRQAVLPQQGTVAPPAWGWVHLLRLPIGVLLMEQAIYWIGMRAFPAGPLDRNFLGVVATLIIDLFLIAVGGWLLLRVMQPVRPGSLRPPIQLGLSAYWAGWPVLVAVMCLSAFLIKLLPIEIEMQEAFKLLFSEGRKPVLFGLMALVALIGPVAEEIYFRGLLYGWLRARIGVAKGLFLSALLFSLLHANGYAFLPILALGLLLGWVYERTGSLAAPIAVHIVHNVVMLALAVGMKEILAGLQP